MSEAKALPETNVRRILATDDAKLADYSALKPHPLADIMPMIKAEPFERLKADILRNGLREKIKLYKGAVLDGRNRYKALCALAAEGEIKLEGKFFEEFVGTEEQAEAYVVSTNVVRRQLSDADKKLVVRNLIGKYPGFSNRKIAEIGGFAHSFVGKVKEELAAPERKREKEYEGFCEWFDNADDRYRRQFVKQYANDLREIMEEMGAKV